MPTLVVRHPDGSETEHELTGELKIGRQDGNDLILSEGGVSRQHARLYVEGGKVVLEDLGSANGTYVDEERIEGPTVLTPQSQVVLGDYALKLKGSARANTSMAGARGRPPRSGASAPGLGSEEGAPRATRALPSVKPARPPGSSLARRERPAPAEAPAAGAGPVLRGLTGPWANKTYPLKGKVMVGRAPPAAVLLEDDSISRKHAELERNARGTVLLRDLGSANGTLLNGERLGQEPVEISPGDIIQFGMVEVVFESGDEASSAPSRRGEKGAAPARGKGGDPSDAPPADKRKKLLVVAAAAVGVLLVAGVVKQLTASPAPPPELVGAQGPQVDPQAQLQEFLNECRSFASMELGNEPQWGKAEAACDKALNIDPINSEANTLIKRIKLEKEASEYFTQGSKLLQRLKEDEALDLLRKIPKESQYFRRAKIKVDEAMEQVKKKALDDCKRYLNDNQWAAAVPRCDRYMGFWCQGVEREELEPPLGFTLSLEGRIGKKQWRPKDKLFVQFLQARKRLDPQMEPWKCPVTDFGAKEVVEGPEGMVKKMFKERYPNAYMAAAMVDYWAGRGNEAFAKLQKVRSNYELASLHGQVDLLLQDVGAVDNLFKTGSSLLATNDVEKAAEPFDEALEVDKRVMGELWERAPSFYRRSIQQDIADKAYNHGRDWAKREDQRRACRIWKVGFRFYKGNTDLIRVLSNVCSTQGTRLFSSAGRCEDLAEVLEWAVPGDGLEEKVAKKREEGGCK
ncbi:FHA domain-containing protein [Hyalangium gracile]|uniref:FHA domain-containing protein n=1 Tax=Hyalangium gracile TaxID=394092 RepID=UPI001CCE7E25|nr:FHA domain-containing protein [Hyalangium gracile]